MNIVKVYTGEVELRNANGTLIRTIGNGDSVGANFNVDDILMKTKKDKLEIRKQSGILINTI